MQRTYFGLKIKETKNLDVQDIVARLFLCPRLSPAQVTRMLEMLFNGKLSLPSFMAKTEEGLEELTQWRASGDIDISAFMRNKLESWSKAFKAPEEKDYNYIKRKYGFTKAELFGLKSCTTELNINSARALAGYVKQYIKGQDHAIEQLAVPFFHHLESWRQRTYCPIKTSPILVGKTGTGKSEILRLLCEVCDCPVIHIDASSDIVPPSWKGLHLTDRLAQEISNGVTIKDLEFAIIVFHECDKIVHPNQTIVGNNGIDEDNDKMTDIMRLFNRGQYLLLESGYDTTMTPRVYKLPVDNLFVVFDGAFEGIEDIIKRRLKIGNSIGFIPKEKHQYADEDIRKLISPEDLVEWGFKRELVGRIGEIVAMNQLSTDIYFQIMKSAKDSALRDTIDYFSRHNIDLSFTDEAIYYLAEEVQKRDLGARGIKTLLYAALKKLYYDMPTKIKGKHNKVIQINKDFIMNSLHYNEKNNLLQK